MCYCTAKTPFTLGSLLPLPVALILMIQSVLPIKRTYQNRLFPLNSVDYLGLDAMDFFFFNHLDEFQFTWTIHLARTGRDS